MLLPWTSFNRNRDKLFFFWSQEFLPLNIPSATYNLTFPTELDRKGDFSQSVDLNGALIRVLDPLNNRQQFPNNIVPATRIDANGQKLLGLFPLPNTRGPGGTYNWTGQSINKQPRRDTILRVDYNINQHNTFYTRLIQDYQSYQGEYGLAVGLGGGGNQWPQLPIDYSIHSAGLVTTLIHTFSPTMVNEFTFGVNRAKQTVDPLTADRLAANVRSSVGLKLPQFYPEANPLDLIPNASYGGVTNAAQLLVEGRFPFFGTNNIWNYSDNLSKVAGSHSLKAGFYLERTTRNAARSTVFNGTYNFGRDANNPLDSNYAYSNGILGIMSSYTEANKHLSAHGRFINFEWYIQDTWKAARRLTIDAGLRFYWIQPSWSEGDKLAIFDPAVYDRSKQPPLSLSPTSVFTMQRDYKPPTVYNLPHLGKGWDHPLSRIMFDGWQVSGVCTFITGSPSGIGYSLSYSTDLTGGTGNGLDSRVVVVDTVNKPGPSGQRFNVNAIKPPTPGNSVNGIGNAAKVLFTNPGLNNWDIAVFKDIRLGSNESRRLQFRWETYNTFNHTQYSGVDTGSRWDASGAQINTNLGFYTGAALARRMQFGLKLYF